MTKTTTTKDKPKKQATSSPERNIRCEAVIIIEAAILVCSAGVFIGQLPLFFRNLQDMPLILAIIGMAITSLLVQGLIVLKQSRRTDQYRQRITALAMTVVYPVVQFIVLAQFYVFQVGPFSSALREATRAIFSATLAFNNSLPAILFMVACTTIGSLWLWKIIAMPKGASYWQPRPADQLSEAEKTKQERGLRCRKIGVTLMVRVPFALICAFILVATLLYITPATILFVMMMAMSAVVPHAVILAGVYAKGRGVLQDKALTNYERIAYNRNKLALIQGIRRVGARAYQNGRTDAEN